MSPCIHGEVCREYVRRFSHLCRKGLFSSGDGYACILSRDCPSGCRFYEPKRERTCQMTVLENAQDNPKHFLMYVCSECHGAVVHDRYDPIYHCPNCGRKVVEP